MTDTGYQNPLPGLLQWVIKGQARHWITALSGFLLAKGALPNQAAESQFTELAMSVILFAAGCIWSAMEKKQVKAAVADGSST
jgi:hypothetical protein